MRIRKGRVVFSAIVTSLLVMTTIVSMLVVTKADYFPNYVEGYVEPNSVTGVRAWDATQNGNAVCYRQDWRNNGTSTSAIWENITAGTTDFYYWNAGNDIDWWPDNQNDPTVIVINREDGTYAGGDRVGYVAHTTGIWDNPDYYPTCELQKIPVPTITVNGTDYINVSWTPLPDPYNLIVGYTLYRSETNDSAGSWSIVSGISKDAPITDPYFNDTGLPSDEYYYALKVVFKGYTDPQSMTVNNYECQYLGEGSGQFQAPRIAYILITDLPDGTPLGGGPVPVGFTEWGYCSAYNDTAGFLGVVSADWTAQGGLSSFLGSTPDITGGIDVGLTGGVFAWLNASYSTLTASVQYDIMLPEVDYIEITDIPNGTQLLGGSVPVGHIEWGNCSAYNDTVGYLYTVSADWEVAGGDASRLGSSPDVMAGINVGTMTGVDVYLNASYLTFTDSVVYSISTATIDYILITDIPGGTPLGGGVVLDGFWEWGNCSAYNDTLGYLGYTVSADWEVSGGNAFPLGSTPAVEHGINVGTLTVDVWLNASYFDVVTGLTHYTSVKYTVSTATIDYILITDLPDGDELLNDTVPVGFRIWGNCSAYNDTTDFIGVVSAVWTVEGVGASMLGSTPAVLNGIDVGLTGGVYVWLNASFSGMTDTLEYWVPLPTVDYILITDIPDGDELKDSLVPVGYQESGYASSYNDTSGYIDTVNAEWVASGGDSALLGATPAITNGIDVGLTGGISVTLTATFGTHSDSVQYDIIPPTPDYILITDIPDGTELADDTVPVGFRIWGNCSIYNDTSGYIRVETAAWTVEGVGASLLGSTPAVMNGIDVGLTGGVYVWLNATYSGMNDSVRYWVPLPTIDYILITDAPDGAPVPGGVKLNESEIWGYCSAYNYTSDYISTVDADWLVGGGDAKLLGGSPAIMNGIHVGNMTVSVWLNATYQTFSDSVEFTVSLYKIDWINITDTPGGIRLSNDTVPVGFIKWGNCSAYNKSAGYIGLVSADWTVVGLGASMLGSTPALENGINVGLTGGVRVYLNASFGIHFDSINYTVPLPTPDYIEITETAGDTPIPNDNVPVEFEKWGYCSLYNNTAGWLGTVSGDWEVEYGNATLLDTTPAVMNGVDVGIIWWTPVKVYWNVSTAGMQDSVEYIVLPPTIDHIDITDTPDGLELQDDTVPVGFRIWGNCSAYNDTAGYIGVVSAAWTVEGVGASRLDPTPGVMNGIDVGLIGGDYVWLNASYSGMTDSVEYWVPLPTVDYIEITDTPGGTPLAGGSVDVNYQETGYCSAYNNTADFLYEVSADWEAGGGDASLVGATPAVSIQIDVGSTGGLTVWLNASFGGHIDNVVYSIIATTPITDSIRIVSQAGSTNWVGDMTYGVEDTDVFYLVGINSTTGAFVENLVALVWYSEDDTVGRVIPTTSSASTTFTARQVSIDDTCRVMATYGSYSNYTGILTVLAPTMDDIMIRDADGIEVLDRIYIVNEIDQFYAAAINNTIGFLYNVSASWFSDDTDVGTVGYLIDPGKFTAQEVDANTACTVTASYGIDYEDSTGFLLVLAPRVDEIKIRDAASGDGDILTTASFYVDDTDTYYAAGYNTTTGGYLRDVSEATWTVTGGIGSVSPTTGASTTFTATTVGTGTITVSYTNDSVTVTASSGDITVSGVTLPTQGKPSLKVKGPNKIEITLDPVVDPNVIGFKIYFRKSPDDPWELLTEIGPDDPPTYTHSGLKPDTKYYYAVTAVDEDGNESPFSEVASATTEPEEESPWLWILLFLIIIIVVLLLVYIMYKRRKKAEEEMPPAAAPAAAPPEEVPEEEYAEEEYAEEEYEEAPGEYEEAPEEEVEYEEEPTEEVEYEETPEEEVEYEETPEEEVEYEEEEPTAPPSPPPPPPPPPPP
ncbi:MAG: fibronectin type III domain-containing protein [Thermoplasmata archaeon]|nr:MAG: fibronectin type III domain-containing protein [Thermoplasmata archaeon]